MGYRRFTDRDGYEWEVKDYTSSEWHLLPVGGSRERRGESPVEALWALVFRRGVL